METQRATTVTQSPDGELEFESIAVWLQSVFPSTIWLTLGLQQTRSYRDGHQLSTNTDTLFSSLGLAIPTCVLCFLSGVFLDPSSDCLSSLVEVGK